LGDRGPDIVPEPAVVHQETRHRIVHEELEAVVDDGSRQPQLARGIESDALLLVLQDRIPGELVEDQDAALVVGEISGDSERAERRTVAARELEPWQPR